MLYFLLDERNNEVTLLHAKLGPVIPENQNDCSDSFELLRGPQLIYFTNVTGFKFNVSNIRGRS